MIFLKNNNELSYSKVNLNFFGEHHGKKNRDTHFSNISKFIKAESLVRQLVSSQDILDAIHKRQSMAFKIKKVIQLSSNVFFIF